MTWANYFKKQYKTPNDFKDKHKDCSVLIIGSGTSTRDIIKYKEKLKSNFDIIIGVNLTCLDFSDVMDYHVIMERYSGGMADKMIKSPGYRKDIIRVLNYKSLRYFPKDIPIVKARRDYFDGKVDIREYAFNGSEGLLDDQRADAHKAGCANYGTVLMQAFHFACIIGAKNIHLIGADLMFKWEYDHYYKDNIYRSPKKRTIHNNLVTVNHNGMDIQTTHVFCQSAKWMDSVITGSCNPIGINVYDFSDGLLRSPVKLNISEFFGESE